MPTTRRTKGAVLAPVRDDPMPRKPRSRGTSIASSQRSHDDYPLHHITAPVVPAAISRLASHNEELTAENEDLRHELEKQKSKRWTLRDKHLAEQLAEYHAQNPTEEPQQASKPTKEAAPSKESEKHTSTNQHATPLSRTPTTTIVKAEAPASLPKWRQLLTSLGGFSPFPARKTNTHRADSSNKEPESTGSLAKLPENRKRSAPVEQEQETPTKKAKTPEPDATHPASQSLRTISEQTELSTQDFAAQTPSRPTRTMPPPQSERPAPRVESTPRRRTIRDVRAAEHSRTPQPTSAARRWEAPSKPREPNADKRLARMQQLEKLLEDKKKMEDEIAKLAAEQEADGIDTRKRKRVKVDELAYIPHNNPGDALGTFRVPEWDSDDEMEVDEAVPVRENVFTKNAEAQPAAPSPAKTTQPVAATSQISLPPKSLFASKAATPQVQSSATAQQNLDLFGSAARKTTTFAPSVLPETNLFNKTPTSILKPATPAAKVYHFPAVGARQVEDEWPDSDKLAAGQKFARGFDSWMATGMVA